MKTFNLSKMITGVRIVVSLAAWFMLLNLVACNENKGGATQVPYGAAYSGYAAGCANCFPNPTALFSGVNASAGSNLSGIDSPETPNITFKIDIMVPSTGMINWYDPKAPVYYSGPASVMGFMTIRAVDSTFCYAPAGDYQITTQTAGMMSALTLSATQVNAIGPSGSRIVMTIGNSQLYNPNGVSRYDTANRIGLTLRLDWVNGRYCGVVQTY